LLTEPRLSVTESALRAGFDHLGRFAAGYRQRFGESPSQTVAEREQRDG
jgi:AraC-like DNA-binding protein